MNIFDSYIDAGQELPQREKERYYTALVEFIAYGAEPDLKGSASAVFTAIRPSLELSKKRADSGGKGGKSKAKAEANDKEHDDFACKQNASKTQAKAEANGQAKSNSNSKSNKSTGNSISSGSQPETTAQARDAGGEIEIVQPERPGFEAFAANSLKAWNRITGQNVMALPAKAHMGLKAAFDHGRTLSDVEKVCRVIVGMGDRFENVNTAFGDNFEQWVNRQEGGGHDLGYLDKPIEALDAV